MTFSSNLDLDARNAGNIGTGGDDDVLRLDLLHLDPSSAVTETLPAPSILPVPMNASILFFLNRKATPLTLASTVASLWASIGRKVELWSADTSTPSGIEAMTGLVEHFRGMQQCL